MSLNVFGSLFWTKKNPVIPGIVKDASLKLPFKWHGRPCSVFFDFMVKRNFVVFDLGFRGSSKTWLPAFSSWSQFEDVNFKSYVYVPVFLEGVVEGRSYMTNEYFMNQMIVMSKGESSKAFLARKFSKDWQVTYKWVWSNMFSLGNRLNVVRLYGTLHSWVSLYDLDRLCFKLLLTDFFVKQPYSILYYLVVTRSNLRMLSSILNLKILSSKILDFNNNLSKFEVCRYLALYEEYFVVKLSTQFLGNSFEDDFIHGILVILDLFWEFFFVCKKDSSRINTFVLNTMLSYLSSAWINIFKLAGLTVNTLFLKNVVYFFFGSCFLTLKLYLKKSIKHFTKKYFFKISNFIFQPLIKSCKNIIFNISKNLGFSTMGRIDEFFISIELNQQLKCYGLILKNFFCKSFQILALNSIKSNEGLEGFNGNIYNSTSLFGYETKIKSGVYKTQETSFNIFKGCFEDLVSFFVSVKFFKVAKEKTFGWKKSDFIYRPQPYEILLFNHTFSLESVFRSNWVNGYTAITDQRIKIRNGLQYFFKYSNINFFGVTANELVKSFNIKSFTKKECLLNRINQGFFVQLLGLWNLKQFEGKILGSISSIFEISSLVEIDNYNSKLGSLFSNDRWRLVYYYMTKYFIKAKKNLTLLRILVRLVKSKIFHSWLGEDYLMFNEILALKILSNSFNFNSGTDRILNLLQNRNAILFKLKFKNKLNSSITSFLMWFKNVKAPYIFNVGEGTLNNSSSLKYYRKTRNKRLFKRSLRVKFFEIYRKSFVSLIKKNFVEQRSTDLFNKVVARDLKMSSRKIHYYGYFNNMNKLRFNLNNNFFSLINLLSLFRFSIGGLKSYRDWESTLKTKENLLATLYNRILDVNKYPYKGVVHFNKIFFRNKFRYKHKLFVKQRFIPDNMVYNNRAADNGREFFSIHVKWRHKIFSPFYRKYYLYRTFGKTSRIKMRRIAKLWSFFNLLGIKVTKKIKKTFKRNPGWWRFYPYVVEKYFVLLGLYSWKWKLFKKIFIYNSNKREVGCYKPAYQDFFLSQRGVEVDQGGFFENNNFSDLKLVFKNISKACSSKIFKESPELSENEVQLKICQPKEFRRLGYRSRRFRRRFFFFRRNSSMSIKYLYDLYRVLPYELDLDNYRNRFLIKGFPLPYTLSQTLDLLEGLPVLETRFNKARFKPFGMLRGVASQWSAFWSDLDNMRANGFIIADKVWGDLNLYPFFKKQVSFEIKILVSKLYLKFLFFGNFKKSTIKYNTIKNILYWKISSKVVPSLAYSTQSDLVLKLRQQLGLIVSKDVLTGKIMKQYNLSFYYFVVVSSIINILDIFILIKKFVFLNFNVDALKLFGLGRAVFNKPCFSKKKVCIVYRKFNFDVESSFTSNISFLKHSLFKKMFFDFSKLRNIYSNKCLDDELNIYKFGICTGFWEYVCINRSIKLPGNFKDILRVADKTISFFLSFNLMFKVINFDNFIYFKTESSTFQTNVISTFFLRNSWFTRNVRIFK